MARPGAKHSGNYDLQLNTRKLCLSETMHIYFLFEFVSQEMFNEMKYVAGENHKSDGYVITPHTMDLLEEHKKQYGGQVSDFLSGLLIGRTDIGRSPTRSVTDISRLILRRMNYF